MVQQKEYLKTKGDFDSRQNQHQKKETPTGTSRSGFLLSIFVTG
jgi:hypothetical protein